ncbi:ABC transporter ATP-binding protein [Cellulosimicrobium cellulans]|uniref:ABC transporter ATP-binding protein n=1 Tax=Cellulosimicrobium cellulans TaxID=1710 RepID=UPI001651EBD6|nr:ABC transporter ATP-binding protein [Cellulosimicrobium cellulans]
MTDLPPAVEVAGLTKRFGDREALADVSFRVGTGHAFGLLGPNGSGKTTTVRLLTGLLTPDAGDVALFGVRVTPASGDALRRRIGVQTDTHLYGTLSARDNLRTWGTLHGVGRRALDERVDAVLEMLGLGERAESLVGVLSKGMRQKLAVGRAILHEPDLVFLDEPTAGLDPEASADLIDHLRQMIRSSSTTVIICTHQLHGLETLCTDVGILDRGRLLTAGPVDTLLRRRWPEHRYALTVGGDARRARAVIEAALGGAARVGLGAAGADVAGRVDLATPDAGTVPAAVAALVRDGIPVHAVVPNRPTIEQLYFATLDERGAA